MSFNLWSGDGIVILAGIGFATGLVGYLVAAWRYNQMLAEKNAQLQHSQQQYSALSSQLVDSQSQLTAVTHNMQQLQVAEGRLQVQFGSVEALYHTTQEELERVTQQRDQLYGTCHDIDKRLEATLAQYGGAQEQIAALREQLAQSQQTITLGEQRNATVQQENYDLGVAYSALKTTLEQREIHVAEQLAQLADAKSTLTQSFENIANKIFDEKSKQVSQSNQLGIEMLLKPFRDQIDGFQKRINEVHDASQQGTTTLNAEIRKVLDIGLQMSKEANNLATALKGDSQQRGAWGEVQLRRTLEMSGLLEESHFEVQRSFKDAQGRQKQTDFLIKLPDGKHIIIDSKVSLVAYDRAIAAVTPADYQSAITAHIKGVRRHIDELAAKDYTNLIGMHSPNFILMFMPIEPSYIEALKNSADLFEYGYQKGVILVSHTTLIPILRTVANLWMLERSNSQAREISEKAGEIYNQVVLIATRLSKLGNTLNSASNHYNETVTAVAGKQGLYGKVDRFNQLSVKISKTLPELERSYHDFDVERLAAMIEPIAPEQACRILSPLQVIDVPEPTEP